MDSSEFLTPKQMSEEHDKKLMDHVRLTVEEFAASEKRFRSFKFESCFDRFVASIGDDAIGREAELWLHMLSVLAEHIGSFEYFDFDFHYIVKSWLPRSNNPNISVIEGFLRSLAKALSSGGNSIASLEEIQISGLDYLDQPARFLRILSDFSPQPYCGVKCLRICLGSVGNECATLIQGMISNAHSLERLEFRLDYFEYMESEAFEDMYVDIVHALLASESLQSCELWWVPERALTTLAKSLASMNIGFDGDAPAEPLVTPLEMKSGLQGQRVRRRSQLKDVSLLNQMLFSQEGIDALAAMLATNNSLKKLEISFEEGTESDMKMIVKGLRSNVCLEKLDLRTNHIATKTLLSELRAEMLSTLESNKTLQEFAFNYDSDKTINRKLSRNKTERQLLETGGGLERTTSSHIRCFLAGEPHVGKSTLKDSICRGTWEYWIEVMKQMAPGDRSAKPRTKGIEMVHVASKGVNIQFWDLGGQPEYHTIHDLFMPTLGGDMAVPPIFLLLFNPVVKCGQVIAGNSSGDSSAAEVQRLRYWLRFIATNCKAERKPCVIPVCNPHLTQKQKLYDFYLRADKVVRWISEDFHETLDIVDEVILIDARKNDDAKKVKKFVFSKAKALLDSTNVFQIMETVQTLVVKSSGSRIPLMTWAHFVGELIPTEFHASGVFNGIADEDLLERVFSEAVSGKCEVGVQDVVNLMLRMELAFKVCDDPKSSLLIPSCLPDRPDGDMISWKVDRKNGHEQERQGQFFGYQIECKDKKQTMVTAGFFHRLQVRFHEKFHNKGVYNCKKDLCEIFSNGYKIYVEFGGIHDDWIDVMVSSPGVSVEESAEWVDKNILGAMYQLCSEPTGLPGNVQELGDLVTRGVRYLAGKVDRNFRFISELKEEVKHLRKEQSNAFTRLCNALSSISVFAIEQHSHRLPHRVYITERKSGFRQKLSFLIGLKPVELHLMCESKDRCHVVDGQEGKRLCLQNEERRHVWTLFKWTILTVAVLLKTGCAISMGIHQLVPDLGGVANWTSFVIGAVGNAGL
ncbi:hypothetical protein CBR_g38595 [Chara braunii]|uniref:C-terminal of Roc (COR) domain-containing protein n=1 Tax=Chara braunii TaxID=69332 RepID=A0A388K0H0_CHABU|nr:hypothetical protein CBR_g38595 [Chara braunii]|eukprot:GBG63527.1 hypothetical protein CBR_g38595 [Chara braunii]